MKQERISAADYQRQFGSGMGNQIVNKVKATNAIRMPKAQKMSKCEEEYGRILNVQFPVDYGCTIMFEPLSFRLPSGCRYCPDWVVFNGSTIVLCVECKGAYRLHSAGKSAHAFKEAASAFHNIKFRHAHKTKDGWVVQNVN